MNDDDLNARLDRLGNDIKAAAEKPGSKRRDDELEALCGEVMATVARSRMMRAGRVVPLRGAGRR